MDNSWNIKKEEQIFKWHQKYKIYNAAHAAASDFYHKRFDRLNISSIVLTGISAILGGLSVSADSDAGVTLAIISASLAGIATIINTVIQGQKPETLAANHRESAKEYNNLATDIDTIMAQERHERPDGKDYLEKISDEMIQIHSGSANIPIHIWNETINKTSMLYTLEQQTPTQINTDHDSDGTDSTPGTLPSPAPVTREPPPQIQTSSDVAITVNPEERKEEPANEDNVSSETLHYFNNSQIPAKLTREMMKFQLGRFSWFVYFLFYCKIGNIG